MEGRYRQLVLSYQFRCEDTVNQLFNRLDGRKHLINLPFALTLLVIIVLGAHEGIGGIWPYLPLLLVFIIQGVWPTRIGWLLTLVLWIALAFGVPSYERIIRGVTEFNIWFLLLWGLVPALILWYFRPTMAEASR
jgi:hypothetical protein